MFKNVIFDYQKFLFQVVIIVYAHFKGTLYPVQNGYGNLMMK